MVRARTLVIGAVTAALLRAARRWTPVRVAGTSMEPTLVEGDLLAVSPVRRREPRSGQIVVARDGGGEIVKRVLAGPDHGTVVLGGDARDRSLERIVPIEALAGVVRARYRPVRRARRF